MCAQFACPCGMWRNSPIPEFLVSFVIGGAQLLRLRHGCRQDYSRYSRRRDHLTSEGANGAMPRRGSQLVDGTVDVMISPRVVESCCRLRSCAVGGEADRESNRPSQALFPPDPMAVLLTSKNPRRAVVTVTYCKAAAAWVKPGFSPELRFTTCGSGNPSDGALAGGWAPMR